MRRFKKMFYEKILIVICVLFFCATVKTVSAADFNDFINAVAINNFDISSSSYDNPLIWTSLSHFAVFANSGTIRGASGEDLWVLNGSNTYIGFDLFDSSFDHKEIHFIGNIDFSEFDAAIDGRLSEITFDGEKINFSSNATAIVIGFSTLSFKGGMVSFANSTNSAIDARSSSLSFNNQMTKFINNFGERGGAVFVNASTLSFNGSTVHFAKNSSNGEGGAFYISDSIVDFKGLDINFTSNTAFGIDSSGGAIHFSNSQYGKLTLSNPIFAYNSAQLQGGALLIQGGGNISRPSVAEIIADSRDIVFIGNKANGKPNDIHFYGNGEVDFIVSSGRKIEMDGGITARTADNKIKKSGAGNLYLKAGSSISFSGVFDIDAGGVFFATKAFINTLNINSGAILGLSADFSGNLSSVLYLSSITINSVSKLIVETINPSSIVNSSAAFIYVRNSVAPSLFDEVVDNDGYSYSFNWQAGAGSYDWIGYLTYTATFTWNDFVGKYQQAAVYDKILSLRQNLTASNLYQNPFAAPTDNDWTIDGKGHSLDANNYTGLGFILNNSSMTFRDISFTRFDLAADGALMNISGGASITIEARDYDVFFTNNADGAVYLTGSAELKLKTADAKKIEMDSGIKGAAGTSIKKVENGDLIFAQNAIINFDGAFNIENGKVFVKSGGNGRTVKFGTLTIANSALYSTTNSFQDNTQTSDTNIDGILSIDASNIWADTISANNIFLSSTSRLYVNNLGLQNKQPIAIMIANIGGGGNFGGIIGSDNGNYRFDWRFENNVYRGYLTLNTTPESFKSMTANALSLAAKPSNVDDLYSRVQLRIDETDSVWAGFYGAGKSIDDFSSNGFGVILGADFYNSQDYMGGIFLKYGIKNIKENDNKGDITETEIGLYGGALEVYDERFNVRGNLSMSFQGYVLQGEKDLEFNGNSIRGGFEIEYIEPLFDFADIKPFIGFQGAYASNDAIKDDFIKVDADNLFRAETRLGLSLNGELGEDNKIIWYGRLYGIVPFVGRQAEYKIKDENGESEIISAKESALQGAIALGGEYTLSPTISIFANVRADFGGGFGYFTSAGAKFKFY
ncbi:MAG: autotransporter domain-containing protein [Endomicrobium sp.]|jgi:hypothetical protein|nr:autotransporter domain-containing protein [Endomicrobium sp.]